MYTSNSFYEWRLDEVSPTVMALGSRYDSYAAIEFERTHRQVEWQEAASLQGFPDDYLFFGTQTKVSKLIAQAVQIDTGRAILQRLCKEVGLPIESKAEGVA